MALPSTDPAVLVKNAKCFACGLPPVEQLAVQTYLLAVIAGVDTSAAGVQTLVKNATCFSCSITPAMQLAIQNYLLVQLLS